MMANGLDGFLGIAVDVSFVLLLLGLAGAFLRLVLGPDMADRVVALDLIAIMTVAIMALWTIAGAAPVVIDVAITLALVAFLATIAFARYIETRQRQPNPDIRED